MTSPDLPLLARGRDAEIYDLGDGLVLRRAMNGRSLAAEAAVMAYAYAGGVPVPAVHDVTPEGGIVMDRVDGQPLLDELPSRPERVAEALADLHDAVHRLAAPPSLQRVSLSGDRLLHLDLHALNVIRTADGPVLIDWANASAGPAEADLAMTWLIHAVDVSGGAKAEPLARAGVRALEAFRGRMDVPAVAAVLPEVAKWRTADRNVTAAEAERVRTACAAFPDVSRRTG